MDTKCEKTKEDLLPSFFEEEMATCVNMVISLLPELNPQASFCGEDSVWKREGEPTE